MRVNSELKMSPYAFVGWTVIFISLFFISEYNYLLFHGLAEIFSIVVSFGIFVLAWNSRQFLVNNYLRFIGVAYLFVGLIDLLHTFAFKGMPIFPDTHVGLTVELWVLARFFESLSLLIAPFLISKKITIEKVLVWYALIVTAFLFIIFNHMGFPACYTIEKGLTTFKKVSEVVISIFMVASIIFLHKKKEFFDRDIMRLLFGSIVLSIFSELAFIFYTDMYELPNMVGHFFKILSFYLIYKAIIVSGFHRPYALLFRELKESEKKLKKEKASLEKALNDVKTLSGLVPICAKCKRIRDDKGYWNDVALFLEEKFDAMPTHGICPDCAQEMYGDEEWYKEDEE